VLSPRRLARRLGPALFALLLAAGCSETPPPPPWQALHTESSYRVLFNDALVAHALFQLSIDADGGYRIEAFTTPAGHMSKADQQILEVSSGRIDAGRIVPQRFDHSVIRGDGVDAVNLLFDWPKKRLQLIGGEQRRQVALLPDTQDRLSYLLAARMLARRGGDLNLQVASSEATEETRLSVIGQRRLELPLGPVEAIGISRRTADSAEERELWFRDDLTPLPLRVVRRRDGNTVEMLLETVVDLAQPASE
jgi:hypothetical protein